MISIEIDEDFNLKACRETGLIVQCHGCIWSKRGGCKGQKFYHKLMAKVGHIGDIDYDAPQRKPSSETGFGL